LNDAEHECIERDITLVSSCVMNYACECKGQKKIVALIMVHILPVPNMKRRSDLGRQLKRRHHMTKWLGLQVLRKCPLSWLYAIVGVFEKVTTSLYCVLAC